MRNIVTDIRGGDKDSFKEFFVCILFEICEERGAMQGYCAGDTIELLGETG